MINIKKLKQSLTNQNIIDIMDTLGADYNYATDTEIHFRSICHNSNSFKLYAYFDDENVNIYCHRCGKSWDIIAFVQEIKEYNFVESIKFICDILHLDAGYLAEIPNRVEYNWKNDFAIYNHIHTPNECELQVYDDKILDFFDELYPQSWVDEGITIDTMKKFGIKYYSYRQSIVIPCYDECGNLIGIRQRMLNPDDIINGKYKPVTMIDGKTYSFPTNQIFYGIYQNIEEIKQTHKVWILESEKAVVKATEWFGDKSVALAMYGKNLGEIRRDYLLKLGVTEVTIMIDSDFTSINSVEFELFRQDVNKIIDLCKGYFDIYVCYNNQNYDGYKYNPFDFTREQFDIMYKERECV